jgi:hypothetical protein
MHKLVCEPVYTVRTLIGMLCVENFMIRTHTTNDTLHIVQAAIYLHKGPALQQLHGTVNPFTTKHTKSKSNIRYGPGYQHLSAAGEPQPSVSKFMLI